MQTAHSFNELYQQIRLRKVPFLVAFFVITFVSYGFLYAIDFIPEPIDEAETATTTADVAPLTTEVGAEVAPASASFTVLPQPAVAATPDRIIFDALGGKTVTVLNPVSNDYSALDQALLSGVVRHPDSADFTEPGNIFILGHSSYLPNVLNKNFQAFNGIQKLAWGDTIRLQSADMEYVYRVEKVYQTSATDAVVPATPGESRLTLATCDVFGAKEDRYVVEAELISSTTI